MVLYEKNQLSSHDPFDVSSFDESQNGQTNVHMLDGAANGFQRRRPKDVSMPTEEEVIAFGGIAPTMARSSVHLQCKDNADDEVMDKARKLAQQRMAPMVTGTNKSSNLSFILKDSAEIIGLASRLGVSLGKDVHEAMQTVDSIKK
jgi:hypothetical protein